MDNFQRWRKWLEELEINEKTENIKINTMLTSDRIVGWLFMFYGISTFVGYLMPIPILYK